jgi:vacuolar protein sorting-associated protein 13A/C
MKGFGTSVVSGVTGFVTKPIEGASKGGVTGFFKGAGKGIIGLAVKPVTGVVDLVSKTT